MEQLKTIGRELAIGSHIGSFNHSKDFLFLIKSIGETRSKSDEDRIVLREIETLKRRIIEPDIPKRIMKEFIIRLLYVEMLGHDASFGYIHAVKMTHDDNVVLKRTGYLAVTLFLNDDHDLIILIVNTIQKDLKSDNYLVVCAALNAVCRLINEETIPAVLGSVVDLVNHPKEAVRKKAIMALHRFYQRSSSSVSHLVSNFRKKLSDNDPSVMGASLCPLFDLITIDANSYKDLVVSFVSILKQVAEHRLPKSYDYHHMPSPFVQIKLLKILALLGSGDKHASGQMYTVLNDIIRKADSSSNIGNAVLYECVCCAAAIHPNPKLLEASTDVISRFLKSDSHNLKYMGIDALGRLIKLSPEVVEQHQLAVIDCLEDPDDTLKRKTFELLYKMTKSSNVEVIVDRMIDYMMNINDSHYKTEIASRCVELAEQFAPSNQWFIQTMNKVFKYAGDLVNTKVAHNLMRLIAEGFGDEGDSEDSQLRLFAVESYLGIVGEPKLPSTFLQVICWVLGEYGTAYGKYSASYIAGKLCDVAEAYSSDDTVKAYAVTALTKIFAFEKAAGRAVDMLPECQSLIDELSASHSTDLQQRAYELQAVIGLNSQTVESVLPIDASCEDIEVDKNLSFLNSHVQQSLEKGAQPYTPEEHCSGVSTISTCNNQDHHEPSSHGLRFEAYELPKPVPHPKPSHVVSNELVPIPEPSYVREVKHTSSMTSATDLGSNEIKLRLDGVQKKWARPSYNSSSTPSTSNSMQNTVNGSLSSKPRDSSYKAREEVDPEKQKFAASLFGGASKYEKRTTTTNHRHTKSVEKTQETKLVRNTTPSPPPRDLLDLSEPLDVGTSSQVPDPFKQLEGLLEPNQGTSVTNSSTLNSVKQSDLMSLYGITSLGGQSGINDPPSKDNNNKNNNNHTLGSSNISNKNDHDGSSVNLSSVGNKGPNLKDAMQKDSLVRQMGVTPTTQNPNLFKDLLG